MQNLNNLIGLVKKASQQESIPTPTEVRADVPGNLSQAGRLQGGLAYDDALKKKIQNELTFDNLRKAFLPKSVSDFVANLGNKKPQSQKESGGTPATTEPSYWEQIAQWAKENPALAATAGIGGAAGLGGLGYYLLSDDDDEEEEEE